MLCNAEWVQADAEGGCDVIRKLEQGPCVQYMRDGGWRVGHVVNGLTHGESNVSLVRESQTGELVLVPSWDLQFYPQSPIPEPGGEAVQDDERRKFREHCEWAAGVVAKWPAWKRCSLAWWASPTHTVPRTPIVNGGGECESSPSKDDE